MPWLAVHRDLLSDCANKPHTQSKRVLGALLWSSPPTFCRRDPPKKVSNVPLSRLWRGPYGTQTSCEEARLRRVCKDVCKNGGTKGAKVT